MSGQEGHFRGNKHRRGGGELVGASVGRSGEGGRRGCEDGARGTPRLSLVQTVGAATGLLDVDREGGILGLVGLVTLGVRNVDVEVRGDSIAALTWAETERPRGHVVTNASMVFTLLCICFGLDVKKGVHIPGEENWRCDRLSRMAEVMGGVAQVLQEIGRDGATIVDLQSDMNVNVLLQGCDPRRDVGGRSPSLSFGRV